MAINKKIVKQDVIESQYNQISKPKKPLEKKEQERIDHEEDEKLEVLGQESEKKAVKWVAEEVKSEKKEENRVFNSEIEWLTYKRRFSDEGYLLALASILHKKMKEIDWPLGYHFKVEINGRNLHGEFTTPFKKRYAHGIRVSGEVKYDHHAVEKLAIQAENTVEEIEGNDESRKTDNGIYLPPSAKL